MGMYDIIETEQVKCFDNLLNHYKIGDKVPCKKFGYSKNLQIYIDLLKIARILPNSKRSESGRGSIYMRVC